ncbi:MAG: DUF2769 domain-containing protein [Methanomassiliicoccales archaeon]|nr:DUF2769 domain-containing protein [Methanomassiliicoccales archaeon]
MGKFDVFFVSTEKRVRADPAEMVKMYYEKCVCPGCPTYNSCAGDKDERVYCFAGKSASCVKESDMSGCICPGCLVQEEFKFEKMYYCIYGSAKEQGV